MPSVKGFERLTVIYRKAEQIDLTAPKYQPDQLLQAAANQVAQKVRNLLVLNLKNSGIRKDSGQLESAVNKSRVWYEKGRLRYRLSSGVNQKVATYANSLNYGWVMQPKMIRPVVDLPTGTAKIPDKPVSLIGEKATRTLKKQLLKQMGQSHRADVWRTGKTHGKAHYHGVEYNSRNVQSTAKGNAQVNIKATFNGKESTGKVTVVAPKPYYYLTEIQAQYCLRLFKAHLEQMLMRRTHRSITA